VSTLQLNSPQTTKTPSQTKPSPLKYAPASVKRPACAEYAQAPAEKRCVEKGNSSIVPTVSPVSVRAWAHWPITKL
jgi:hypothetical protein